jgi:PAS domain S-box-containing protein
MTAERDLRAVEGADSPEPAHGDEPGPGDVLLAAAVDELRERAERLHKVTEDLAGQNERLLAAQEALEDERARYRELFDLAPDAFVLTDADGRIVEANGQASDFLGVRADLLVREALAGFVEPAARDALQAALLGLTKPGQRRTADLRMTPRDGATLDVEATVAAVPQRSDGAALLWLLRDVSARVGAARSLGQRLSQRTEELDRTRERAERERVHLRDLFQRLQEGIVAVDVHGAVVYANEPAKHLFSPVGLVEGEPLPEPWPGVQLGPLVRSLFTTRPMVRDLHVTTDEGRVLALRGIAALGSETAGLVVTDVSTRERRELAEREFVANAAHELRTPLAAMSGAIEVLQSGAKDDPAVRDRFLDHIERECARLERLSTALLLLARAQMGVESPRLEVVPLRPVLDLVARETHPASGVRLEVSCVPDLAAFANRSLVEQALGNLASNAAKHTHHGSIALRGVAADDRWVSIEVADTGPGIAPDRQLRAAERFYRAGGAEGFGLGLAIATEAARAVGGRLELDSEPGRGTTARIVLPSAEMVTDE